MKNLFLTTAMVLSALLASSQIFKDDPCVTCNENNVDLQKYSSAIGTNNTSTGERSFAGGVNSQATGNYSFAFGEDVKATQRSSFAVGYLSEANGAFSAAIGRMAITSSSALHAMAFGLSVEANASAAFVAGRFLRAAASNTIVLGGGYGIEHPLINNIPRSMMVGFNSNVPTFFVGESSGVGTTGNIGIGNVTDPAAKLHILADAQEDATLRLEATAADKYARIYLGDAHHITAANQQNMKFSLPADRSFIFENGKVGIGTNTPVAKLHVNGNFQVGDAENPQEIWLHGSINAEGEYATALGFNNTASGNYSFVVGENSSASGRSSVALGQNTHVLHNYSFALGRYLEVHGSSSYAIGRYLKTLNPEAMVIGYGFSETQTLNNNVHRSLMIGFESTKPTLFIGPSNGANYTGKVGIGNVTDPQAKLHIRADAQEDATLRLEAIGSGKHARMYFTEEHYITAGNDDDFRFRTTEGRNFVFQNGDIYIEEITHGIIMKSPNGQCWRGTLNDQGMLVFAPVACPDEGTTGSTINNSPTHDVRIYPNPANKFVIIETSRLYPDAEVIIAGVDGRQHLRQSLTGTTTQVNIENLTPGTYLVAVEQNELRLSSQKLVVN